ncbi:hypothetical protein GpartN1_g3392.t1 [Galdieria partita]|uniref:Uncharacterized protein n=1 Tax=Galdieria partita TaxID=83374 RepID=A0A9C7PW49_9RHOD|nr:hypothetical protein GpartN1_g3392.t1 [Galdieria partita]
MAFVVSTTQSTCCQCSEWKRRRGTIDKYLLQDKVYKPRYRGCPSLYHQLEQPTLALSYFQSRSGVHFSCQSRLWQAKSCTCCDSNYFFDYGEHVSVELKQLQVVSSGSHCLLVLSRTATDTVGERYDQLAKDYEASLEASVDDNTDRSHSAFTQSSAKESSVPRTFHAPRVIPVFMSISESMELIQTIHRQSGHSVIGHQWYGYGSNALLNFARLLYFLRKAFHMLGLVENMAKIGQPRNSLKLVLALFRRIIDHTKYPTFQACFYEWMVEDVGFEVEQVVLHGVNSNTMISDIQKHEEKSSVSENSSYSNSLNPNSENKFKSSHTYASCCLPVSRPDQWIRARLCLSKDGRQFFVNLPPWDALGLAFLASLQIPIYVHASLWIRGSTSKGYIPCYDSRIIVAPINNKNDKQNTSHGSSLDETVLKSRWEERKWNSSPSNAFPHSLPFRAQRHSIPFHSPEIHQIIPFRRSTDQKPTRFIPFTEDVRHSLREMLLEGQFVEAQRLISQLPSLQWELEILDAIRKEDYLMASRLQSKLKMVTQLEKILLRQSEGTNPEEMKETSDKEEDCTDEEDSKKDNS